MPDEVPPGSTPPDAPPAPQTVSPGALSALLAFWKEADSDLPLLVEARAMRARLVGR
jgi:hypothetical protein